MSRRLHLGARLGAARTAGICAISPALFTSFAASDVTPVGGSQMGSEPSRRASPVTCSRSVSNGSANSPPVRACRSCPPATTTPLGDSITGVTWPSARRIATI